MGMPALHRHWTVAEVRALNIETPSWPRYELIDGELLVTPAPGWPHQIAIAGLVYLLTPYVRRHAIGVTIPSPADVELEEDSITQPDVFVAKVATPNPLAVATENEQPDLLLIAEVISPSSRRTDRVKKRVHYLRNGVPDYWVVDLDARVVERWSPGCVAPTVLDTTLEFHPVGASEPLVIDLVLFFETVWREWEMLGRP